MARPNPTFYVFHGSDEFTLRETVKTLRERQDSPEMADLNTTWLDGRKVTLDELRHACEAVPFLADRRLVLVTGLLVRLGRKGERAFLRGVQDLLRQMPQTTRLILIEEETLPANHPLRKQAQEDERGYERCFEPPSPRALPGWIVERGEMAGGQFEPEAAARLAEIIGPNLRLLDQEIDKLIAYVNGERPVSVADVARLVPYDQEAVIFDLVDALGQRNGTCAASTLQQLLDEGSEEMYILAMVIRHFRYLIQVKELRDSGENAASIAGILGQHPFPVGKWYRQATNFTATQLEQIYRYLLDTDLKIKGGKLTPGAALDLLVAGLTGG